MITKELRTAASRCLRNPQSVIRAGGSAARLHVAAQALIPAAPFA